MYLIQNMTRPQVEERVAKYPVAILPVGSCEQHGPHLPLGTDTMLAEALSQRVSDLTGAMVLPTLNFGYAWVWRDIAGTVSLPVEHFSMVLQDIAASVGRYGIRVLAIINGHEANGAGIKYAIRNAQDHTKVKLLGMFYPNLSEIYKKEIESPTWGGMFHACEFETSLMLAVRPELVNMELAVKEYPEKPVLYGIDNTSIGDLSKSGVYGDATLATKEKGERMVYAFSQEIAEIIEHAYKEIQL